MGRRRRLGCGTTACCLLLGGAAIGLAVHAGIGLVTGRIVTTVGSGRPVRSGPPRTAPLLGDSARWCSAAELVIAAGLLILAIAIVTPEEEASEHRLKIALAMILAGVIGRLVVLWPIL